MHSYLQLIEISHAIYYMFCLCCKLQICIQEELTLQLDMYTIQMHEQHSRRYVFCSSLQICLARLVISDLDLVILQVAHKMDLQCLVEVHTVAELQRIMKLEVLSQNCMLGINNRDLQTFKVDLNNNKVIMESSAGQEALKKGLIFAGESGIFTPEHVAFVKVRMLPSSASVGQKTLGFLPLDSTPQDSHS